jgi:hypothetical protein
MRVSQSPDKSVPPRDAPATSKLRWLKRLGVAGVLFFLIKGLLWLAIPTWLVSKGCGS